MLKPIEIAAMVTAVSVAIAQGKNVAELNILSAVFSQIGDTLAMIAIQTENIEAYQNPAKPNFENAQKPAEQDFFLEELN